MRPLHAMQPHAHMAAELGSGADQGQNEAECQKAICERPEPHSEAQSRPHDQPEHSTDWKAHSLET